MITMDIVTKNPAVYAGFESSSQVRRRRIELRTLGLKALVFKGECKLLIHRTEGLVLFVD